MAVYNMYKRSADRYRFTMANTAVASEGGLACIDTATGTAKPAAVSATLIPIGFFCESLTGDGTTKVTVQLLEVYNLYRFKNSGTSAVDTVGSVCFMEDVQTVRKSSTGASMAGLVFEIASDGIWVRLLRGNSTLST